MFGNWLMPHSVRSSEILSLVRLSCGCKSCQIILSLVCRLNGGIIELLHCLAVTCIEVYDDLVYRS